MVSNISMSRQTEDAENLVGKILEWNYDYMYLGTHIRNYQKIVLNQLKTVFRRLNERWLWQKKTDLSVSIWLCIYYVYEIMLHLIVGDT